MYEARLLIDKVEKYAANLGNFYRLCQWQVFFFLEDDWTTSYSLCFYTDVAQSIGYGLIFGKQWA